MHYILVFIDENNIYLLVLNWFYINVTTLNTIRLVRSESKSTIIGQNHLYETRK